MSRQISTIFDELTHLFPIHPSLPPKNIIKPYGCLMFPGAREMVHCEQMG